MSSRRITVRVPKVLENRLQSRSRANGQTPSEIVRVALESYLEREPGAGSAYDLAQAVGIIGCVHRAPADLSTNRRHFEGFGKRK